MIKSSNIKELIKQIEENKIIDITENEDEYEYVRIGASLHDNNIIIDVELTNDNEGMSDEELNSLDDIDDGTYIILSVSKVLEVFNN